MIFAALVLEANEFLSMPPRPDIDEDFIDGVEYRPGRLEITDGFRRGKRRDKSRSREFFDFHWEYLLPLKREWFLNRPGTDVLRVDTMDRETMGKAVLKWVDTVANNH